MPLVSVVIPCRDDGAALSKLLAQLTVDADVEVIASCAPPLDTETERLRQARPDVRWVESAPGRGVQLNRGAADARGEWLWFVHADSRLPAGWIDVFRNLRHGGSEVPGGAFRFALDSPAWQARVLERAVRWRVRWCNLPYGDQGIFVRRDLFVAMGGFAPLPLMEDVEFVRRLARRGRLWHPNVSLTTSARRWERAGWWRRSAGNVITLALYGLGVSPERLARRYDEGMGERDADQETR